PLLKKSRKRRTRSDVPFSSFWSRLFANVPSHPVSFSGLIGAAPVGAAMVGGGSASPIYNGLSRIFDRDDVITIFQAFRSGCEYFLTLDHATILSRTADHAAELKRLCPALKFGSPRQLAAEFENGAQRGA